MVDATQNLLLKVFDEDNYESTSDMIGEVSIPLSHLCAGGEYDVAVFVKKVKSGIVYLRNDWRPGTLQKKSERKMPTVTK